MIFLYKSYADLNILNKIYKKQAITFTKEELIKKTLYLDLLLASKGTLLRKNNGTEFDFISFQSKHSLHRNILTNITYIVKDKALYRLESLRKITKYPVSREIPFQIDFLGKIEKFKLFLPKRGNKEIYLLVIKFKNSNNLLFKVKIGL